MICGVHAQPHRVQGRARGVKRRRSAAGLEQKLLTAKNPKFVPDLPNHLEGILVKVSGQRIFYLIVCSILRRMVHGPLFALLPRPHKC